MKPNMVHFFLMIFSMLMLCDDLIDGTAGQEVSRLPQPYHHFHPLPGVTVNAHCQWEAILDTVYNRIPTTITQIRCLNTNAPCSGNRGYHCRQIKAKMLVAYVEREENDVMSIVHRKNYTVSVGCACAQSNVHVVSGFNNFMPMEKRGHGSGCTHSYGMCEE